MKPVIRAQTNKSTGATSFEFAIPFEDGREAVCQVFPVAGSLRYRYLVRTPAEAGEKAPPKETEYFSEFTRPQVMEAWNGLPEAERGPAPLCFTETDLQDHLSYLAAVRQAFLHLFWVPIPGQEVKKAVTPAQYAAQAALGAAPETEADEVDNEV